MKPAPPALPAEEPRFGSSAALAVLAFGGWVAPLTQTIVVPMVPLGMAMLRGLLPPARYMRGVALISALVGVGDGPEAGLLPAAWCLVAPVLALRAGKRPTPARRASVLQVASRTALGLAGDQRFRQPLPEVPQSVPPNAREEDPP